MKTCRQGCGLCTLLMVLLWGACGQAAVRLTPQEIQGIAKESYVYGFHLAMNYTTLYSYAIGETGQDYQGPFNQMACEAHLFTPEDKAVVTSNAGTLFLLSTTVSGAAGLVESEMMTKMVTNCEPYQERR